MNSEEVWRLWRRVLREPALAAAVIDGSVLDGDWGLDGSQREIVQHYALNPGGVGWAVEGYRFRLVRVTRYCVAAAAPLTAKALIEANCDLGRIAQDFVEHTGWLDRGPYVLGHTLSYLDYLLEVEFRNDAGSPAALADVVLLEAAGLRLAMQQAGQPPRRSIGADRLRWTGRAAVATVEHDVLPWLAEPTAHPLREAPKRSQEVLLYLDDSVDSCRMVALTNAAAAVARLLGDGAGLADVAGSIGVDQAHPGLAAMLETFLGWGIIAPADHDLGHNSHISTISGA